MGTGDTNPHNTPTLVTAPGLPTNFVSVAAGYASNYALTANGRPFAWGDNQYGQLGSGGFTPLVPAEVFAPSGFRWASVGGGQYHVVATVVPKAALGLLAASSPGGRRLLVPAAGRAGWGRPAGGVTRPTALAASGPSADGPRPRPAGPPRNTRGGRTNSATRIR